MKGNIVIKIGGSLLFTQNNEINSGKITELCNVLKSRKNLGKLVIICGGGLLARDFIKNIRLFNGSEALCDTFGIEISQINARLLISCFQDYAYPQVPKSIEELSIALLFNKIIVMGGLQPGQSTTSVALEVAEFIQADKLIILTDVDGIYDKDPKKFSNAKLLKKINYDHLQKLILLATEDNQASAGEYRIFDAVSLQILKRSEISVMIMSGTNLNNLSKFLDGEKDIIGTEISKE
ncbi:MAG: UMP kinase [Candidatus Hermodarchaeota archaeon]